MEVEDIRKNAKILIDGIPYNVEENEFMKPGKGRAIYRLKLRNLLTGSTLDRTYHSGAHFEDAHTNVIEGQYLYKDNEHYIFMNTKTFDQLIIDEKILGNKKNFLKENIIVSIMLIDDKPNDVTLPNFVELKVFEVGVSTKTGTITPQMKSASLETGYVIGVPSFIKEGDIIMVDTRSGLYSERIDTKS